MTLGSGFLCISLIGNVEKLNLMDHDCNLSSFRYNIADH